VIFPSTENLRARRTGVLRATCACAVQCDAMMRGQRPTLHPLHANRPAGGARAPEGKLTLSALEVRSAVRHDMRIVADG
jgi:hypothetical protein